MKKKTILKSVLLLTVAIIIFFMCVHITLVRTGTVRDALTNDPIQGAVVCYFWPEYGMMYHVGGKSYETKTDENGRYCVPPLIILRLWPLYSIGPEKLLVYKDGYAGNMDGRSFYASYSEPQILGNTIKLERWRNGEKTQLQHFNWLRSFGNLGSSGDLLDIEMEKIDKKISGEK